MDSTISLSTRSLQFYAMAKKWFSDVEFLKFETDFFERFLKTYYGIDLVYNDRDLLTEKLVAIGKIKKKGSEIELLLTDQLKQLDLMADDIIPEGTLELSIKQVKLENSLKELINGFRSLKKDIYMLAEQILLEHKRLAI